MNVFCEGVSAAMVLGGGQANSPSLDLSLYLSRAYFIAEILASLGLVFPLPQVSLSRPALSIDIYTDDIYIDIDEIDLCLFNIDSRSLRSHCS